MRTSTYLLLLAGLLIAGWRGWGLHQRGLLEHDEGHNLLAARTYAAAMQWVLQGGPVGSSSDDLAQLKATLHRQGGTLYPAGKPGYVVFLAFISLLAGGPAQAVGLWLSWAGGLIMLGCAAYVIWHWSGRSRVAVAVFLVGANSSPVLGYLSREVGGPIWSLAFGTAGLAVLSYSLRRPKRRLLEIVGGIFFGYGFTCHYNLLPFIGGVVLADFFAARHLGHGGKGTSAHSRPLRIVGGCLGVICVFQFVSMAAESRLATVFPKYQNYLSELWSIVHHTQLPVLQGTSVTEGARGYGAEAIRYIAGVFRREGVLFLGAAIAATLGCAVNWRSLLSCKPPGVLVLAMALFWIAHPWKVERSWGMLILGLWMLIAVWVAEFLKRTSSRRGLAVGWCIGIALVLQIADTWWAGWRLHHKASSPIPSAVRAGLQHMETHGGSITATSAARSFAPLWKWAVVEELRTGKYPRATAAVDFSSFEPGDILFLDPASTKDTQFLALYPDIAGAQEISSQRTIYPDWQVSVLSQGSR